MGPYAGHMKPFWREAKPNRCKEVSELRETLRRVNHDAQERQQQACDEIADARKAADAMRLQRDEARAEAGTLRAQRDEARQRAKELLAELDAAREKNEGVDAGPPSKRNEGVGGGPPSKGKPGGVDTGPPSAKKPRRSKSPSRC